MTIMTRPADAEPRTVVSAPALAPATIAKPNLLTVEDAKALDVAAHDRPVQGARQSGPAAFHEAARLPQGEGRARRGHVLHRPERPQDPRLLRRLRLARLRPQPSAHPRRAQEVPGREAARDRHRLHVAVRDRAGAQPRRLLARRPRHGVPRLLRLGGDGGGDQGGRARRRPEALEDRLCRELLPRQDQGRAVDHRRQALPRRVHAHRQHGARAVRRHRRDRERVPLRSVDRRDRAGDRAGRRRHHPGRGRILAEAARALRQVRRDLDRRRGAVRLRPHRPLLRLRALRRRARHHRAGQIARRRQGGDRRHDRPARHLHEGLRHAEDGDDPRHGHLRRHRRGLRDRDRGAEHALRRGPDRERRDDRRLSARAPEGACRRSTRTSSRTCAARA